MENDDEDEDDEAEVNEEEQDMELDEGLNLAGYGDDDYDDMDGNTTAAERVQRAFESEKFKSEESKADKVEESMSEEKKESQSDKNQVESEALSQSETQSDQEEVVTQAMLIVQPEVQQVVATQSEQISQTDRREVRMGSSNKLTEDSIIAKLMRYDGKGKGIAMDRKEMKKIARRRLDAKKSEVVDEELLKSASSESELGVSRNQTENRKTERTGKTQTEKPNHY